jgi:uncharacterized repeat protein (TIGR01451 family)
MYLEQGSATLSGGQIRGNNARHHGGGVYVYEATAAFTQTGVATITHNTAGNRGGGLYVYQGRVTLGEGTLCNNKANGGPGGGMYVAGDANVRVSRGQIFSNTAYYGGGGVYHSDGTLTLVNTTIGDNRATSTSPPSAGGGIYVDGGTAVLTYTTVASNTANSGGRGVHRVGGAVFLRDTIVAHNGANNCAGTLTSNGYNLEDANTCGFNAASDQSNTDPRLGPLTDDGGTLIYPLLLGSPAVDAGACVVGIATDQRGQPRPNPASPFCDIGAYEAKTPVITVTKSGTAWFNPQDRITYTLHVANTGTLTATNIVLTDALPAGATFVDAGGGELESGNVVSWTVSSIPPGGGPVTRTFTVTATDTITNHDYRATPEGLPSVRGTVVVASSLNHKPAADAGASQTVAVGGSVTLDGSGSRDDDGHPLVYGWAQTGGTEVTLIGATSLNPTFAAPTTTGVLTFALTVTDTLGMSDADTTTVTVEQYRTYLPLVLRDHS